MAKFRKKPVVVEAIQFTEDFFWKCREEGATLFGKFTPYGHYHTERREIFNAYIMIPTLEGEMRADLGDWIIRGVKGEFYPCKPDIFEKSYEPVE